MEAVNVAAVLYQAIALGLVVLFFFSFALFIRRLLINSSIRKNETIEINRKLDHIIDLLEKDKKPHEDESS